MSLTRKMLKAMGIEDEKIDQIIEAHTETVDALKEQRDGYKADADKLPDVQKKLDETEKQLEANGKDSYKVKYDALKEDFENYKSAQTEKETHGAKLAAYRNMLKDAGISEKRLDSVLKVSDVDGVELDEQGNIKDIDTLSKNVKTEWADFIVTETATGAKVDNPPANNGAKASPKTLAEALHEKYNRKE